MESEARSTARLLPRFTRAREERVRARIRLTRLSEETGIPLVTLSEFERGLRKLSAEKRARRSEAIRRLKETG
jgi:predicted nucleic acid-binding protein